MTRRLQREAARAKLMQSVLLRSAKRQAVKMYTVADASLHQAAPVSKQPVQSSQNFPPFIEAVFPVSKIPEWGAMRSPAEWNRSYDEMTDADFVGVPAYNMQTLTIPMLSLTKDLSDPDSINAITAKLFYSTRFMGSYNIDAGEHSGTHAGVDLKLAPGTPIGAIAGGRVQSVDVSPILGLHVIIEHRLDDGTMFTSIYGHFADTNVTEGETVTPGQTIGTVGMSGNTSGPHLHLQVDDSSGETINPITFIKTY